jgi:2-polyprenyl-3-methyl-5-hydroxy-6-metoxy-1,4-benzoquinol methylase
MSTYIDINKAWWNAKTKQHLNSDFYAHELFLKGHNTLNDIELELLGDVRGKSILHLQCHFGQDTLSLARMGAKVCGVDLSEVSIEVAQKTAADLKIDADFICSDIFKLDEVLDQEFDIVFTSYGTICWLPDMDVWAGVVERFLKPGGTFVFADFHPVVWMFDDDFKEVTYGYFNTGVIIEINAGSYASKEDQIPHENHCWNHDTAEVMTALLDRGLQIKAFREYNYSPYDCFSNTVAVEKGFNIIGLEGKIPMVFSLKAVKPTYT